MSREWGRSRLLVAMIVVLVAGAVGWVWWIVSLPSGQRGGVIQLSVSVLTLVTALVSAVLWLWRARREGAVRSVDTLTDLLAHAVHGQWRTAATERVLVTPTPIPVHWSLRALPEAGDLRGALDGPFWPLPGLAALTEKQLRAGGGRRELFEVYAGLGSGRVVVVGSPGSGKSGSAVLLLLDVLDHRAQVDDTEKDRVAVPVLFTAHSWDPTNSSVQDWLCDRLAETYPLFQHRDGHAEAMALAGARDQITLILDGLDEMDEALRPAALRALSDAPFRVIVLSRSHEMSQATRSAWFVGAVVVHLDALTGCQAADYLQRAALGPPPSGWSRLLTHLREQPNSVSTRALCTPLAVTLIRDTYRTGDDVSELLDADRYRTVEQIEQHLIARVLPEAYTARPGRPAPGYSPVEATQTLAFIARQMNDHHTRDFAWWHVPRWAPATPRILVSLLACGLLGALVCWLLGTLGSRLAHRSGYDLFHLGFGLGLGTLFGLAHGRGGGEPKRIRSWRAVNFRSFLIGGLVYGFIFGVAAYVMVATVRTIYLLTFGIQSTPPFIIDGFVIGTMAALPLGLKRAPKGAVATSQNGHVGMLMKWRAEGAVALIAGLLVGLLVGLAGGRSDGLVYGFISGLMIGPVGGLLFGTAYGITRRLAIRSVVEGESSPLGPRESWRNDRILGVVAGLVVGLSVMAGYWLYTTLVLLRATLPGATPKTGIALRLTNGIVFGIVMVIVFGITSSVTWPTAIAWLQLKRSRHVPPIALMAFLEDARNRGVLRTVGATYQFRHATLQDQLAQQTHK